MRLSILIAAAWGMIASFWTISPSTLAQQLTIPAFPADAVVRGENIRLRTEPTANSSDIAVLQRGDAITVTGESTRAAGEEFFPVTVVGTGAAGWVIALAVDPRSITAAAAPETIEVVEVPETIETVEVAETTEETSDDRAAAREARRAAREANAQPAPEPTPAPEVETAETEADSGDAAADRAARRAARQAEAETDAGADAESSPAG